MPPPKQATQLSLILLAGVSMYLMVFVQLPSVTGPLAYHNLSDIDQRAVNHSTFSASEALDSPVNSPNESSTTTAAQRLLVINHPVKPVPPSALDPDTPEPPRYIHFQEPLPAEPVEMFSLPPDRKEARIMRESFLEEDVIDRYWSITKYDTGNYTRIPASYFSIYQSVLPSFDVAALQYAVSQDYEYFKTCTTSAKVDARFIEPITCKQHEPKISFDIQVVHKSLVGILKAWSAFASARQLYWWISHGEMIGWFWNSHLLPWDQDLDFQLPLKSLLELVKHNGTVFEHEGGTYLIDVSPKIYDRAKGFGNTIDGRMIDMATGHFVDITGLTHSIEDEQVVRCKSPHYYHIDHLMPLHETTLEGVVVWRPRAVLAIISKEYHSFAYKRKTYVKEGEKWQYHPRLLKWVKIARSGRSVSVTSVKALFASILIFFL